MSRIIDQTASIFILTKNGHTCHAVGNSEYFAPDFLVSPKLWEVSDPQGAVIQRHHDFNFPPYTQIQIMNSYSKLLKY